MDARQQVRLDDQQAIRPFPNLFQRAFAGALRKEAFAPVSADAEPGRKSSVPFKQRMAEQCKIIVLEPGKQGSVFCREPLHIGKHCGLEAFPIIDGVADICHALADTVTDLDAIARVGPVGFDIDQRFGFPAPRKAGCAAATRGKRRQGELGGREARLRAEAVEIAR